MTSQIDTEQYGQALLKHVQYGAYPESEEVISAELPPTALPQVAHLIEQARDDVKVKIKAASKDSAPDIDGWISQAKRLQVDIRRSQATARDIIEQAQQGEYLAEKVNDAASKVDLLTKELGFNDSLGLLLQRLRAIQTTLDNVQRDILDNRLLEAVEILGQVNEELGSLSITTNARISGIYRTKVADLRSYVQQKLTDIWNSYICVDSTNSSIRIMQDEQSRIRLDLGTTVTALGKLSLFHEFLQPLCQGIENMLLVPRLQVRPDGVVGSLEIKGDIICMSGQSQDLSARALFEDLDSMIEFFRSRLPSPFADSLADLLVPKIIDRLLPTWLSSAVPESLDGLKDFEDTTSLVKAFGQKLESLQWPGKRQLFAWLEDIPNAWVRKRRENSLNRVRIIFAKGLGDIETVERIETQVLARDDEVFSGKGEEDEWNANWSDDETSPVATKPSANPVNSVDGKSKDEEDVSAWGLDEDDASSQAPNNHNHVIAKDDDGEAWGWGDDNNNEDEGDGPNSPSLRTAVEPKNSTRNGTLNASQKNEQEVTLKEKFNITALPNEILAIIDQVLTDIRRLETAEYASSPIGTAATHLLSLPGLILAMYRAISSVNYLRHPSGPMFLYNDSLWLAHRFRALLPDTITASGSQVESRNAHNLQMIEHVTALESFGKRSYAKEMESQRTVLTDLLDGAQGFVHCTEHPFNQECDIAVASTVDRLHTLHRQWKDVLSQSALLQTLGSLLSTITNKIIVDIEDMSDISEPESQQLTTYCNRIAALENLFLPDQGVTKAADSKEQERVPLTALYAPHWLKFQYLANILESSLVDIKYLWTEGELGLEFDTEELVDLITALFADSPHRRNAVAEIRGRRGVR